MWGRAAGGGWWALVTWDRHVGYDDPEVRYTGTQTCTGRVAARHVTPADDWVDTSAIARVVLGADPAAWPRPVSRPGAYLPANVWWVGVLDGAEPGLPPGVRPL